MTHPRPESDASVLDDLGTVMSVHRQIGALAALLAQNPLDPTAVLRMRVLLAEGGPATRAQQALDRLAPPPATDLGAASPDLDAHAVASAPVHNVLPHDRDLNGEQLLQLLDHDRAPRARARAADRGGRS